MCKDAHHEERSQDILQLMARFAAKSNDPLDHDPRSLCSRILALNFVGIHTSSAAAMGALVNILCAGPEVFAALRREAASVLRGNRGVWDKAAVGRLALMDSTLRESLRFSAFKARGVERQVVKRGGVFRLMAPSFPRAPRSVCLSLRSTRTRSSTTTRRSSAMIASSAGLSLAWSIPRIRFWRLAMADTHGELVLPVSR